MIVRSIGEVFKPRAARSLRDELARGPLPLTRLLDLSAQIADGLAAAHAMDLVHGDLMPERVTIARDGTIRIRGFDLDGDSHAFPVAVSAYTSPEQARGSPGDFRSDQFALGALMYEMATGVSAFHRRTVAETVSALLHDEPASMVTINQGIPSPVAWVVEQCLAKDPAERYAATEDLGRELRRLRDRLRETPDARASTGRVRAIRWAALAVMAIAAGATATAVIGLIRRDAPAPPGPQFTPIATSAAYEGQPAWSLDGHSIAWVADVDGVLQLFVRRLADAVATQVTFGAFDVNEPFWGPHDRLYYTARAGQGSGLWTVGPDRGRPQLLLQNVGHAAIDPAGQRLAFFRFDLTRRRVFQQLWWASADGDNPVRETRAPFDTVGFGFGGQLSFRPDGQQLLLWVAAGSRRVDNELSAYYLVSTAPNGPVQRVLSGLIGSANMQPASWLPDNRHVVVGVTDPTRGDRHLWIADTQSAAVRQLTRTHTSETWPSVSPDGQRIAYASEEVDFDLISISEDGSTQRKVLATSRNEMDPAWSPNGDRFAFVTDRAGVMEIWQRSRDGQWERPLVKGTDFAASKTEMLGALAFSPDGRALAYQRRGPESAAIWLTSATGGTPVRLTAGDAGFPFEDAPSWSPDGEWISFIRGNGSDYWLAKVRAGTNGKVTLLDNVLPFSRPAWSPDGRWIAYQSGAGILRLPAEGGRPETVFDEYVLAFAWTPDSRRVVALLESDKRGHLALVEIDAITREVKTLNTDLGTIPIANQPIRGFSFVKGQGFLTSFASARSDIWMLEGFALPRRSLLDWLRR